MKRALSTNAASNLRLVSFSDIDWNSHSMNRTPPATGSTETLIELANAVRKQSAIRCLNQRSPKRGRLEITMKVDVDLSSKTTWKDAVFKNCKIIIKQAKE